MTKRTRQQRRTQTPRLAPVVGADVGLNSLEFAEAARALAGACQQLGLEVPLFRTPPRRRGLTRSIRRRENGKVTIAVQTRGRPRHGVLNDLIDGVLVANYVKADVAAEPRDVLWRSVAPLAEVAPNFDDDRPALRVA